MAIAEMKREEGVVQTQNSSVKSISKVNYLSLNRQSNFYTSNTRFTKKY